MSDDLLRLATRALRDETAAPGPAAAATRQRVVGSLRAARSRRASRLGFGAVLIAAALGSSAWAAAGRLDRVAAWLGAAPAGNGDEAATSAGPGAARGTAVVLRAPAPLAAAAPASSPESTAGSDPAASASAAPLDVGSIGAGPGADGSVLGVASPDLAGASARGPGAPGQAAPARAGGTVAARALGASGSRTVANGSRAAAPTGSATATAANAEAPGNTPAPPAPKAAPTAVAPASDADAAADAIYARAHTLHFQAHDDAAALAAWEAYLRAAPRGRYAVVARYNRAICLARLGRAAEADAALRPFADGAEGGYRRGEARALRDALGSR